MNEELKQYIAERFDRLEQVTMMGAKEILTVQEAALFTGFAVKGIYSMTCAKEIPYYKKGGRVYFRKAELERWLTQTKIRTNQEIEAEATTRVVLSRRRR